jgi:hypothetical protein
MSFDSSGNLGLGVTPFTNSLNAGFDLVGGAGLFGYGGSGTYLNNNAYYNSGWKYKATAVSSRYEMGSGHQWFIAPSGTAGNAITFTQAMTLDGSGNLGIGDTSPATSGFTRTLSLNSQTGNYGVFKLISTAGSNIKWLSSANGYQIGEIAVDSSAGSNPFMSFRATVSGASTVESMRLDSSGNLLVGTTSQSNSAKFTIQYAGSANNGLSFKDTADQTGTQFIAFHNNAGTQLGSIEKYDTNSSIRLSNIGAIRFPATQTASADANTLDDYEEGTWTPTITFGGNSVGITYNATFTGATYTKIGNRVCISGYVLLTNKGSSTGDASISNLPFTSQAGNTKYVGAALGGSGFTFTNQFWSRIAPNNNNIDLYETTALGSSSTITNSDFSNGTEVYFSATYTV